MNICKQWELSKLRNLRKIKVKKWAKDISKLFQQRRRHTEGRSAHKSIICYQKNVNKVLDEMPPHIRIVKTQWMMLHSCLGLRMFWEVKLVRYCMILLLWGTQISRFTEMETEGQGQGRGGQDELAVNWDRTSGQPTILKELAVSEVMMHDQYYSDQEAQWAPKASTWDCTGEYGLPGSPLNRVSLFIFVFRQAMYRLQKSLQSSLTFSSSRRWMRRTWIAFTI